MSEKVLDGIISALKAAPAWQRKNEISLLGEELVPHIPLVDGRPVLVGDDTAAIETDDGYLLLAAEIMFPPLVHSDPYLAGKYSILANANDVYAMGGYPLAVVDVILAQNTQGAAEILHGLRDGSSRYGCPVVGGHLTATGDFTSLAVCILGRAKKLLTSFNARPGDVLLHATGLQGTFHHRFNFWDCSAHLGDAKLRQDLAILPTIAEAGWCDTCRDVSMAGILGSTLMLLEPSGVGAVIDLNAIPRPADASDRLLDWLLAFPAYGFIMSVRPRHVQEIISAFSARSITCAAIGEVTPTREVILRDGEYEAQLWDLNSRPFMGFSPTQNQNGIAIRR